MTFKKNVRGSLGAGKVDNYVTILTTRCSLEKKRANKINERGQIQIAEFFKMICRFENSLLSNLSGSVIAVIDDDTYTVHDFNLIDERKHLYEFILSKNTT